VDKECNTIVFFQLPLALAGGTQLQYPISPAASRALLWARQCLQRYYYLQSINPRPEARGYWYSV